MFLDIMGTRYKVLKRKYTEDEAFARSHIDGYCDSHVRKIVYCDMTTYPNWEHEDAETATQVEKATLRHEIVHAFLNESGLQACAMPSNRGWAENEEMVDWIALQGPKIYAAWQKAGAV